MNQEITISFVFQHKIINISLLHLDQFDPLPTLLQLRQLLLLLTRRIPPQLNYPANLFENHLALPREIFENLLRFMHCHLNYLGPEFHPLAFDFRPLLLQYRLVTLERHPIVLDLPLQVLKLLLLELRLDRLPLALEFLHLKYYLIDLESLQHLHFG